MDQRAASHYAQTLQPDAVLVYNASLVPEPPKGSFRSYGVEASRLATEAKLPAANMAALGAVLAVKSVIKLSTVSLALPKALGPRKIHLAAPNFAVLELGFQAVQNAFFTPR
jgi:Pyruvate/2-oxoacid:ferredoxin oxidoreductase gamma subunit